MSNIQLLRFDTRNGKKIKDTDIQMVWQISPSEIMSIELKSPTDFRGDVTTANLRDEFEQYAAQGGSAIVDFQVTKIKQLEAIRQIYKFWSPELGDMRKVFLGTIAFPFAEFCFIVKAQCVEVGTTGTREAVIALTQPHLVEQTTTGEPIHVSSAEELFSRMKQARIARNPSDDEEHDHLFPDHPLTKVRSYLKHIEDTLVVDSILQSAKPYRVGRAAKSPENILRKINRFFKKN